MGAPTRRQSLTAGEVLVGGAVVAVATVAEVSLLLAEARVWSLAATVVAAVAALAVAGVALARHRPPVRWAPRQLVVLAVLGGVTAVLVLPGFPVGMAGWDPGVYTEHGLAIARTGADDVPDPVVAHRGLPDLTPGDDARFPGMAPSELDGGRSYVGFFHLYPALLAPAADVGGERGVVNVNPLLGVLVVLALTLLGWRVFGPIAGTLAGALAATNVIQLWHARYPTSEVLTELLLLGALLAVVLARDLRWPGAAAAGGALTSLTFLARADGFMVVLLAAGGLFLLAATGRFDRRAGWFAAGLGVVAAHGFVQAYWLLGPYTELQGVPGPVLIGGLLAVMALATAATWPLRHRAPGAAVDRVVAALADRRWQRAVGAVAVVAVVAVVAGNYLRPLWNGPAPRLPDRPSAEHYYDARGMVRLTWFLTPLGIAALGLGLAAVALRRWTFPRWLVVLPSLVLLPVYLLDAHVAVRLMWWTRRFVPFALPGLLLLTAVGLSAVILWRGPARGAVRLAGWVAAIALVAWWSVLSWPLLDHDEMAGSFGVYHTVAATAGRGEAVWLWSTAGTPPGYTGSADAFASTLLLRRGDPVARFDRGLGDEALTAYRRAFAGEPLFVVADGDTPPPELTDDGLQAVKTVDVRLPVWEITYDRRPTRAQTMAFRFTVWRAPAT